MTLSIKYKYKNVLTSNKKILLTHEIQKIEIKGPFYFLPFVPGLVLKSLIRRSRDGIIAALLSGIGSSSIVGFKEVEVRQIIPVTRYKRMSNSKELL